jgi:hypothetical protein
MRMRVPLLAVLVGVLGGGCGTSSTVQSSVVDFDKAFDDSLVVLTTDLPPAVVGKEYRFRLRATGQPKPFLWALVSGHLPKGLSLDGDVESLGFQPRMKTRRSWSRFIARQGRRPIRPARNRTSD